MEEVEYYSPFILDVAITVTTGTGVRESDLESSLHYDKSSYLYTEDTLDFIR